MARFFSTALLIEDNHSKTALVRAQVNLHPGSRFSVEHRQTVLLAGGFPSLSPNSEIPLSATLFLNSSLTDRSDDDLHRIARAELQRTVSTQYRSYSVEPDNRVAVLGNDAKSILSFIDAYGGVLQIEPLLMKGCHPELPAVAEISISTGKNSCTLQYQVRTPIDQQACSYCGSCGPSCPEGCIDERLFLDLSRCSLCRQCETSCPAGAIDVHAVQLRTLEIPALILLGNVQVEAGDAAVFREADLPAYFSTLLPFRLDEVVTWHDQLCQYSGRRGYGCTRCASVCRFGAISLDGRGVQIDPFTCEACGDCVAVCPTGALQYEKFSDLSFSRYLSDLPALNGTTVVIGSDEALHRLWWLDQEGHYPNTVFIACEQPKTLSLFHFLSLATRGVAGVVLLDKTMSKTRTGQLELANHLFARLFDVTQYVHAMDPQTVISEGIPVTAPTPLVPMPGVALANRRQLVADSLEQLVSLSGRRIDFQADKNLPFATIICDRDACTLCGACLNDCKIGALSGNSSLLTLLHTAAHCVACGLCIRTCPEQALSFSPTFSLLKQFFTPVELSRAEPMACKRCGKIFGTKQSYDRVMTILLAKETVDVSHFAYCDTCRVQKIFEEQ